MNYELFMWTGLVQFLSYFITDDADDGVGATSCKGHGAFLTVQYNPDIKKS